MKFSDQAKHWHSSDIDPSDRQPFKQFGTSPPGTEFLYRFYDDEMRLLYVGITWNPFVRWTHHAKTKPWWGDVSHAEVWLCRDDRHARDVETWCIRHLDPQHNIHQNERRANK